MYKVKGTALMKSSEFEQDFETLEEAEEFIRKMAINFGVEATLFETKACGKYVYPYKIKCKQVTQLLDEYGVDYELDKNLNIKIEF